MINKKNIFIIPIPKQEITKFKYTLDGDQFFFVY